MEEHYRSKVSTLADQRGDALRRKPDPDPCAMKRSNAASSSKNKPVSSTGRAIPLIVYIASNPSGPAGRRANSALWVKVKNPNAPGSEAEDWRR
jgi:hypothetical protein